MVVDFFQAKGNLPIENLIRPTKFRENPIISEEESNNGIQKNVSMNHNNHLIKVKIGENRKTLENKIKSLEPLKTLIYLMMKTHGKPRTFIQTECDKIIAAFANANLDAETLKRLFEQSKKKPAADEYFQEIIGRQLKDFWSLYAPVGSNMEKITFFLATTPQCKQWLESGKVSLESGPSLLSGINQQSRKKQQTQAKVNLEAQVGLNFGVKKLFYI